MHLEKEVKLGDKLFSSLIIENFNNVRTKKENEWHNLSFIVTYP